MPTKAIATRKPRGLYPKRRTAQQLPERKSSSLPEYLEQPEVETLIRLADPPEAALIMLTGWRSGLRISEILGLTTSDLELDSERPTLRVRKGKGNKARVVPVHPELVSALRHFLRYRPGKERQIFSVSRYTALRWIKAVYHRALELGAMPGGKKIGTHTLRHSYARHLLLNGIPINYVSRWLGHSSLQTTLIYLEIIPDPSGSLATIP